MYPSCKILSNPWRLIVMQACRPGMIMAQIPSEGLASNLEEMKLQIADHVLLNEKTNTIEKIQKNIELFWLRRPELKESASVYHQQLFRSCVRERRDFHSGQPIGFDLIAGLFSHAPIASMRKANMAVFFVNKTKVFVVVAIKPISVGETLSLCWCPSIHQVAIGNEYIHDVITSMHAHVEKKQPLSWTLLCQSLDLLTRKCFTLPEQKQQQLQQQQNDYISRLQHRLQQQDSEESHEWTLFLYENVWCCSTPKNASDTKIAAKQEDNQLQVFDSSDVLIEDSANKTKDQLAIAKRVLAQSYKCIDRISISLEEVCNFDIGHDWIQNVINSGCKTGSYSFASAQNEWVFTYQN